MLYGERVPAEPFAALLQQRYEWHRKRFGFNDLGNQSRLDPVSRTLAQELGWGEAGKDGGVRQVYRYRHCLRDTKRQVNGRWKGCTVPADSFQRGVVEDALHCLGHSLEHVYESWAAQLAGQRASARAVLRFMALWEPLVDAFELEAPLLPEYHCVECGKTGPFEPGMGECIWCMGREEFTKRERRRETTKAWDARRPQRQLAVAA